MSQFKAGDWVRLRQVLHGRDKADDPCSDAQRFGLEATRQLTRVMSGAAYYRTLDGANPSISDDHLELANAGKTEALQQQTTMQSMDLGAMTPNFGRQLSGLVEGVNVGWDMAAIQKVTTKKEQHMHKHYRLLQNLPELEAGAILKQSGSGYTPIQPIWDTEAGALNRKDGSDNRQDGTVVEHSPEWFEEIYETSRLGKTVWQTKEAAKAEFAALFTKKK